MPDYLFYDDNGRIYKKKSSISSHLIDEGLIEGYKKSLLVDRATFNSITKYHKVENGQVRLMTQAEIDALTAIEENERKEKERTAIDNLNISVPDLLKALIDLNIIKDKNFKDKVKENKGLL